MMKHEEFLDSLTVQQLRALSCQNGVKTWNTDSRATLLRTLNKRESLKGVDDDES